VELQLPLAPRLRDWPGVVCKGETLILSGWKAVGWGHVWSDQSPPTPEPGTLLSFGGQRPLRVSRMVAAARLRDQPSQTGALLEVPSRLVLACGHYRTHPAGAASAQCSLPDTRPGSLALVNRVDHILNAPDCGRAAVSARFPWRGSLGGAPPAVLGRGPAAIEGR